MCGIVRIILLPDPDVPELVIADRRSEVNVSKGVDYQLECSYRGLPAPQIIWNKNNALVDDETQYTIKEETTTEENSKYVKVTSQLKFKGVYSIAVLISLSVVIMMALLSSLLQVSSWFLQILSAW